jgi:hypothetical protein
MNRARQQRAAVLRLGRRLFRADPAQEQGRAEERQRVGGHRERGGEQLDQQPAHAGAADEGHGPAAVDQRVALDVAARGHQRHEQHGVGHGEQDAQGPGSERDQVELAEGEHAERVADRDADQQRGAAQVRGDHGGAAAAVPVRPRPRVQREQQAGQPHHGGEVAHGGRAGVQREHRDQRERDRGDLVAEHRDRLRAPVAAERPVPQQLRDPVRGPPPQPRSPRPPPGLTRCPGGLLPGPGGAGSGGSRPVRRRGSRGRSSAGPRLRGLGRHGFGRHRLGLRAPGFGRHRAAPRSCARPRGLALGKPACR